MLTKGYTKNNGKRKERDIELSTTLFIWMIVVGESGDPTVFATIMYYTDGSLPSSSPDKGRPIEIRY